MPEINVRDVKLVAIAGIVILGAIALLQGHNGTLLTICVAPIAGLAGYELAIAKSKP